MAQPQTPAQSRLFPTATYDTPTPASISPYPRPNTATGSSLQYAPAAAHTLSPQVHAQAYPNNQARLSPNPASPEAGSTSPFQRPAAMSTGLAQPSTGQQTNGVSPGQPPLMNRTQAPATYTAGSALSPAPFTPQPLPPSSISLQTPQTPSGNAYTGASFAAVHPAPPTPGTMGPPARVPDRPTKDTDYEFSDMLAGTGVSLREEESKLQDYYTGTYMQASRTGFASNTAGGRDSFYGAGFANQPGEVTKLDQKIMEAAVAEQAWKDSAARLASSKAQKHNNQFLQYANLHAKAGNIAKEYGLDLNFDLKSAAAGQKNKNMLDLQTPKVTIKTVASADGTMIATYGSVLPLESFLLDQLALLSLATKHRMRDLVEDASRIATTRQQTSHGVIPERWADAGVAAHVNGGSGPVAEIALASGTSLKRTHSSFTANETSTSGKAPTNHLAVTLRQLGKEERDAEEARLLKRQKRAAGQDTTSGAATPKSNAAATATTGSVAPEPSKAPGGKKAAKKSARDVPVAIRDQSNTSLAFLGLPKKKGKAYSWMNAGAANTPARSLPGSLPGTPGGDSMANGGGALVDTAPVVVQLTKSGRNQVGYLREYEGKGKNIQLRDWVAVLERDGREKEALQRAYDKLDDPEPK